jgi:hypothetical protein
MKNTSNSNCKIQSKQQISMCHFSCLTGSCKKVLCAVLITCPWYEMTQKERGEQARHNTVYVIYMSYDNQSLAPVNQHVLDEAFVSDQVCMSYDIHHAMLFICHLTMSHMHLLNSMLCSDQVHTLYVIWHHVMSCHSYVIWHTSCHSYTMKPI